MPVGCRRNSSAVMEAIINSMTAAIRKHQAVMQAPYRLKVPVFPGAGRPADCQMQKTDEEGRHVAAPRGCEAQGMPWGVKL